MQMKVFQGHFVAQFFRAIEQIYGAVVGIGNYGEHQFGIVHAQHFGCHVHDDFAGGKAFLLHPPARLGRFAKRRRRSGKTEEGKKECKRTIRHVFLVYAVTCCTISPQIPGLA